MHLLDTDTLSRLHAGHPRVVERVRRLEDPEVVTTVVSKIELLRGRFDFLLKAADGAQLLKAQHWLTVTEGLLDGVQIVPVDTAAATIFDRLRARRELRKIGRADLLIASISLARNATLVTRNLRHFRRVPRLSLANWVD